MTYNITHFTLAIMWKCFSNGNPHVYTTHNGHHNGCSSWPH